MPLAFQSLNHGTVAFGFFNIKTDALLLNEYFFFAQEFCSLVSQAASSTTFEGTLEVYIVKDPGDLHGAIEGIRYTGLIGEIYKLFPFPKDPKDFKQDPEGYKNRDLVEELMKKFGEKGRIDFKVYENTAWIGRYAFDGPWFCSLIDYVIAGGYPRWKDGLKPFYVEEMERAVKNSVAPIMAYLKTPTS